MKKAFNPATGSAGGVAIRYVALILLTAVICPDRCLAQLKLFPLEREITASTTVIKKDRSNARTQRTKPLTLPFWDDFSHRFLDLYPDTALWQVGDAVWVNDGMAINPPTIGVATFDGLNSAGKPYNPTDIQFSGFTDSLTSHIINLSETGDKPVALGERASVYLSFFYQWKGNGEAPDETDFLQVEFLNDAGAWVAVQTLIPDETFKPDTFYTSIIQVVGNEFFHDGFQFRFLSFGRQAGPYDTWNLDYVYLNKGRSAADLSFPDRAIATSPGPLFGRYRAMPRRHLVHQGQITPPYFEIQNLKNADVSVNFRTEGFFSSSFFGDDTVTVTHQALISKATPINITDNVILANEHKTIRLDTLPSLNDVQQFPAGADSTLIRLTIALQTKDNVPLNLAPPTEPDSTGDYTVNYRPIEFTRNDTIVAEYALSSYYAYDDGIAEYAAGLIENGNLVAIEFELPQEITQDTLIGFDVYFPPYGITSNQTVDFFIYQDDNGKPGEVWLRLPSRPVRDNGLNIFQRYQFIPALLIDQKKFYIGWKEPVAGTLLVGLDISNDTGDKVFVNTNGTWYQNDLVRGSLMVRPIFGSGQVDQRVGVEETKLVAVYPNPSSGTIYIEGHVDELQLLNATGQQVHFSAEPQEDRTMVRFHQPAGLYFLRFRSGKIRYTQKVIVLSR